MSIAPLATLVAIAIRPERTNTIMTLLAQDLNTAISTACHAVLESPVANPASSTPYPFDWGVDRLASRFHLRVIERGDETRIEYASGSLDRKWTLVLDVVQDPETQDFLRAGILLALVQMRDW